MISFEILTLFPDFFLCPLKETILGKARERGALAVAVHNLRDYAQDKHHVTDDYPFGGGVGMVLKPEPVVGAIETVRVGNVQTCTILLTPQGERFSQRAAEELTGYEQIILVCGRYEGVDDRIREYVDREISIGDYILSGGEAAALVIVEVVSRLLPGVLGKADSKIGESFTTGLIEYPQYTRPRNFRGHLVPEVLLSGNHEVIRRWRLRESLRRTLLRRPDLLESRELSREESSLLRDIQQELGTVQGNDYESLRSD